MLPIEHRLKNRDDFARAHSRGKMYSDGVFSLKAAANGLAVSRIGISIGVKFSKSAVDRNKMKRRLKQIFRRSIDSIRPGFDIIVFAKQKARELDFSEIREKTKALLCKSNLLKK